jgi:hypothetical protein
MSEDQSPPISAFFPAAIILGVTGWVGLFILVSFSIPTIGPRWLFFFLGVLALTGTALPIIAFLNRRFTTKPPATRGVVLREAIWAGIYLPTLAWLQIGRALSLALVLLLAIALCLIEWLLRMRDRSQWNPQNEVNPPKA